MSSMWCCYSQRPVSPLPNNRPVGLPRPAGARTPVFQRLTIRKALQGSETRDASKESGNLQPTRQAFGTSGSIDATPIGTPQTPNPIDVPQPSGHRSRLFTRFTTRNASKDSSNLQATRPAFGTSVSIDATPIGTSQTPNPIDVPQPSGRRSRFFTRFITRNASKDSEDLQSEAKPIKASQPATSVDIPRPVGRHSRIFTRLTTRKTSKASEDTQAEASPVETSQDTNLVVDVPHPVERQSRIFTRLMTQNTSEANEDTQAEASPIEISQNTSLVVDVPHPVERRSRIFTHLSPQNTPKRSEDLHTDATPDETNRNTYLVDAPQPAEHRSRIFTHLITRKTSKGSDYTSAKASSSSLPDLAYPYDNHASALASTLSLPSLPPPPPPASPPPPAASPPPPAAPPSPAPPTPMTLSGDLPPPRRSLDSVWVRYPSHDRRGRSMSPAGGREGVAVRDFAPVVVGSPARAVRRARSMGDLLRGWARRHERHMAKPPGGHRSSIAPGGLVEYPELELVAPATPFAPAAAAAAAPAAEEEDLSASPSAPAPQPDLPAPSSEDLAAQFPDCEEEDPSEDGEADLARGLYLAEVVALRREVNHILAEEMALGLYEGDFI